ncbi:MAG: lactonase family protein [Pseudomonas sp.]|uniref:lactonase family protein n=1 Tax=Pseudomonas sp. TaxID=306 RepID=UPI0030F211B5
MSTPHFLAVALATALALPAQAATYAYISSPNDGLISQYQLDESTGAPTLVEQTPAGSKVNPMAISPDGQVLYAALRVAPFSVLSYRIEPKNGHLEKLGQAPLADSLAYISTDRSGRFLMGASYGASLLSVQAIDAEHRVSDKIDVYKTGPIAHSIRSDRSDKFVYAANLGTDSVLQFSQNKQTGALTPIGSGAAAAPAKMGPRHLAFSPNGKFLYVVGELSGTVVGYAIDASSGALRQVSEAQSVPASLKLAEGLIRNAANNDLKDDPTPRIWAADIRLSPDGTLLYTTERTTSSVSAFKVEPSSGALTFIGNFPVAEKQPRNIAFFPSGKWLLVTGEKSAVIGSYAVAKDGSLKRVGEAPSGDGALWIEMWQSPK